MTFFRTHRVLLLLGVIILVGVGAAVGYRHVSDISVVKDTRSADATATSTAMQFEVVTSQAQQELGLGNRSSIPDNYGMLFVFKDKQRYGFWMKDMLAPIDIIWLSDNGTVLLIDHSVDPATYPHAFYPPVPVRYVLETRAGYAADHGWDAGTEVPLPAPYGS